MAMTGENTPCWALGLMSGTSMDGIDAALIRTDGETVFETGAVLSVPYDDAFRARLRALLGTDPESGPREAADQVADILTRRHADAVDALLTVAGFTRDDVRVVGFHGHTVLHRPEAGITRQIGDGALLAELTGIDVVADFRSADMAAGGEGAPLAPAYHQALARDLEKPVCVLNLGGVGNVTWLGPDGGLLAFDTGPGNALLDDWVQARTGAGFDADGRLAASGTADAGVLARLLDHPYFAVNPPKSLDRNDFSSEPVQGLSDGDGAATLAAFTVEAVIRAQEHFPARPERWLVTGGGRHNATLMRLLADGLGVSVAPVEDAGWDGDGLEAEAFAFLAVRALKGAPLTWPETTGVSEPLSGGRIFPSPGAGVSGAGVSGAGVSAESQRPKVRRRA